MNGFIRNTIRVLIKYNPVFLYGIILCFGVYLACFKDASSLLFRISDESANYFPPLWVLKKTSIDLAFNLPFHLVTWFFCIIWGGGVVLVKQKSSSLKPRPKDFWVLIASLTFFIICYWVNYSYVKAWQKIFLVYEVTRIILSPIYTLIIVCGFVALLVLFANYIRPPKTDSETSH